MKLYVWTDVLRDWSSGMIVALAPDLEEALAVADSDFVRAEMGRAVPEVLDLGKTVTPARVWYVCGGG